MIWKKEKKLTKPYSHKGNKTKGRGRDLQSLCNEGEGTREKEQRKSGCYYLEAGTKIVVGERALTDSKFMYRASSDVLFSLNSEPTTNSEENEDEDDVDVIFLLVSHSLLQSRNLEFGIGL